MDDWSVVPFGLHEPSLMTLDPPDVIVAAPPPSMAQANAPPLPSITLFVSVMLAGAPNVATRMPDAVPAGAMLPANVELVTVSCPSVWKMPPPCHAVDVLPLNVLLTTVALPSDRSPPATSPPTLPDDRAAGDVDRAVEEPVDPTARLVEGRVVADRAVGQIQRGAVAVVDAAAAECEVRRPGAVLGVVGDDHTVEAQGTSVQDAAALWCGDTVADHDIADGDGDTGTDAEHAGRAAGADRHRGSGRGVDGHRAVDDESAPDVNVRVPPANAGSNVIVPPSAISASASRSEPGPLSSRLVTTSAVGGGTGVRTT